MHVFIFCCQLVLLIAHSVPIACQMQSLFELNATFQEETDSIILDQLLDPKRYDRRQRPLEHTVITAAIQLFSVASPDESSLHYEVEFLLTLTWEDPRLLFNDGGRHSYLKALHHANALWIPDIYFINHGELKQSLVDMSLKVFSNGTVLHVTKRSMIINCQGNLKIFPFDNPKCPFAFESIAHETPELKLQWSTIMPPLDGASSLQYHNAYLIMNKTGECDSRHTWRGNFSCLRVLLVFTRDKAFYFSTVFGPGMLLVTSSFISFWLDVNVVPARVMIGVTTMLNFCTTTNNFRSKLPVVSNLRAMNLWDGVCMFFIYASLIEFVIENFIERKYRKIQKPPSERNTLPPATDSRRRAYADGDDFCLQPIVQPSSRADPEAVVIAESKCDDQPIAPNEPGVDIEEQEALSQQDKRSFSLDLSPAEAKRPIESCRRRPPPQAAFIEYIFIMKQKSRSLDDMAKLVFPFIFGVFISCFFLTYGLIKPQQSENWELVGGD